MSYISHLVYNPVIPVPTGAHTLMSALPSPQRRLTEQAERLASLRQFLLDDISDTESNISFSHDEIATKQRDLDLLIQEEHAILLSIEAQRKVLWDDTNFEEAINGLRSAQLSQTFTEEHEPEGNGSLVLDALVVDVSKPSKAAKKLVVPVIGQSKVGRMKVVDFNGRLGRLSRLGEGVDEEDEERPSVSVNLIDCETQVGEYGGGIFAVHEEEVELEKVMKEIAEKRGRKRELEMIDRKLKPALDISDKFGFVIGSDSIWAIKDAFGTRQKSVQTEVNGNVIEYLVRHLESQEKDFEDSKEAEKTVVLLEEAVGKLQAELNGTGIHESDFSGSRVDEITLLKDEFRAKLKQLNDLESKKISAQNLLDLVNEQKSELEIEVSENSLKEKPHVYELEDDVSASRRKLDRARANADRVRDDTMKMVEQIRELMSSNERTQFRKLLLRGRTLNRRVAKWKIIVTDGRESIQSIEHFSALAQNKRQHLKTNVEKCEAAKFDKEEELRETEFYKKLLDDLLAAEAGSTH